MINVNKDEMVCKGLECCKEPYVKNCSDPCPYLNTLECREKLCSDALSVIRELQAENKQLKDKRINAKKRIEKLIEQYCYLKNANAMGMVGGLRIALEIIGDEPKEGE